MPANAKKPVYAPYIEHVPPDVTAGIFWLKNRHPQHSRDSQQLEQEAVKIFMPANRADGTGVERTLNAVILGHRLARKTHQQTSPRVTADLRCR